MTSPTTTKELDAALASIGKGEAAAPTPSAMARWPIHELARTFPEDN